MAFINVKTKQYPLSEQDIRNEYPNTSFAVPFQAPEDYYTVFESPTPEYNTITQFVREIAPKEDDDGNWVRAYEVVDLDEEQIAYNESQAKQRTKQTVMNLLAATDWVEVPSVSDTARIPHLVNYEEFMTYRMALRSIAVNPTVTIDLPALPEEQWTTE